MAFMQIMQISYTSHKNILTFDGCVVKTRCKRSGVDCDDKHSAAVKKGQVRGALHPFPVAGKPESHLELRLVNKSREQKIVTLA